MTDLSYANIDATPGSVTDMPALERGEECCDWSQLYSHDKLRIVLPKPPIDEVLDECLDSFDDPDPVVDLKLLEEGTDWTKKIEFDEEYTREDWDTDSDDERAEMVVAYLKDINEYDTRKRAYYENAGWDAVDDYDEILDEYRQTRNYDEWADGFFPMMNAYWPVDLPYGADEEEIATKIDKLAGCASLVEIDGIGYAIVMPGGGMDLSWDLAAAYLCCGVIPPVRLLEGLPIFGSDVPMNKELRPLLAVAFDKAIGWAERKAARLREEKAKWF